MSEGFLAVDMTDDHLWSKSYVLGITAALSVSDIRPSRPSVPQLGALVSYAQRRIRAVVTQPDVAR